LALTGIVPRTIQALDALCDDLDDFAVVAFLIDKLPGFDSAVNGDEAALAQIVRNEIGRFVPRLDSEEVGGRSARVLAPRPPFIDGNGKFNDVLARVGGTQLRIANEPAAVPKAPVLTSFLSTTCPLASRSSTVMSRPSTTLKLPVDALPA
jgi:hypothetical protein